ncbi:threonine transporter RhtB [Vibrio sp. HA2012]|uniref:LysE family translocator n=1 Tax=Vibrio sp. HA2012 TaxID=1971595 RepID=UPI000C2B97DA|nr:LysE family translocator [Vibrio sp. HA2012]PJC87911.1 threonine transporter RhtB [Vibrio sp. HA2012]
MYIQNFEAFLIAITILTLTPGIDTALVIKNSSRSGVKDGCVTSFGICSGLFVHATFSSVGISAILLQSAQLFQVMKWIGALYLIWLGINSLKATYKGVKGIEVEESDGHRVFSARRSLREGFLSNVLNPKTAVFYLAFLPQFINPEHSLFVQSFMMAGIHFLIAMIWQSGVATAVTSAQQLVKNSSLLTWMEGITGSVLIALGIKLIMDDGVEAS